MVYRNRAQGPVHFHKSPKRWPSHQPYGSVLYEARKICTGQYLSNEVCNFTTVMENITCPDCIVTMMPQIKTKIRALQALLDRVQPKAVPPDAQPTP